MFIDAVTWLNHLFILNENINFIFVNLLEIDGKFYTKK